MASYLPEILPKKGHGHINFEKTYSTFGDSQNSLGYYQS